MIRFWYTYRSKAIFLATALWFRDQMQKKNQRVRAPLVNASEQEEL